MKRKKNSSLNGIIPMIYSYFNKNGSIDKILMKEQIKIISKLKVSGIAALGLGTEVNKLTYAEKKLILEIILKEKKKLPLAITIQGKNKKEYLKLIDLAKNCNVDWIILQPLIKKSSSDISCYNFFKSVIPYCDNTLVGIQNAKEYLGIGLNNLQIRRLYKMFSNFRAIKAESPAILLKEEIKQYPNDLLIFNGRGGQEIIENLMIGCSGIVPTPECSPSLIKIYNYIMNNQYTLAENEYKKILPTIVFIMQSIDTLTFYGKRIFAKKLGVNNVYDRKTNLKYDYFSKQIVKKFSDRIDIN